MDVTLDLSGGENRSGGRSGNKYNSGNTAAAGALEVDRMSGAVVVNGELAASSRVWVAGDAACFPSPVHGGQRLVLRSADHAHHSGKVAGENMAAAAAEATGSESGASRDGRRGGRVRGEGGKRYRHTPAFVGEAPLAGVRMAMIGECDAAMPTHGFWWVWDGCVVKSATGETTAATYLLQGVVLKHKLICFVFFFEVCHHPHLVSFIRKSCFESVSRISPI